MPDSDVRVSATFAPKRKVTVSFNAGAVAVTDYVGESIVLPAFAGAEPEGYKFVGWAEQTVDETTDKPVFFAAGATYTMPETDKTLYALFTHTEGGTSEAVWTLVEDASTLKAGDKLVIASSMKDKTAGNISSNYMTEVATTFSEDKKSITELGSGTVELTLGGKKDSWTLTNSDGKLLGATKLKSVAWDKGTTTWNITIENGGNEAIIQNTPSDYGRFLHNVNGTRFTTYSSAANATMLLPQLYRQTVSDTTYYTTSPDTTTYTLTGIEITTMPTKTTFAVNEAFSSEGLVVTATYTAEKDPTKTKTADVTSKVSITGGDTSTAGTKTVNVSYTEGETTKTATYKITVKAAYTLTYDKNTTDDVTGLPEKVTGLAENEEYTLSTAAPVRANYNFAGWAMSSDSATPVTAVTMDADKTVYAIWQEKTKFTVSFYPKEGATPIEKVYYEGDTVAAADIPTIDPIEGYAFKGWYGATYNNAAAPAYVTPAGTKVTANLSFYAVYAEISSTGGNTEYTLTEVSNIGANDSVVVTILKDGTYYALPTADATNSGPLAKSTVTVSGDKITSTVDATITWKIDYRETDKTFTLCTEADSTKKLNLTNNNNGVRVSKNSSTFTVAENGYLSGKDTANTVRYIGIYNTEDWRCYKEINTNIAGQTLGFYVKAGEIISGYTTNPVVANSYNVTWYNEDGTTVFATTTVKEGRTITAPTGTPTKDADGEHWYEFSGWAKTKNGEAVTDFGKMGTEAQSFYALFTAKDYTLTATITGGATTAVGETLQLSAKLTSEPAGADVSGYMLAWSSNSEIITVDADGKVSATDAGTATVTATFTKGSSTVTATFAIEAVEKPAFTLVTPRNAPEDWSGEYVIAGRYHNVDTYANTYAVFSAAFPTEIPDRKSRTESGSNAVALGDTGIQLFADGTELAKNGDDSVHQYSDENLVLANKMISVSDDYVWLVECVDDINQYYTIKEKKYDIYLAAQKGSSTDDKANSIGFALSGDGNLALWQFEKWVVNYDTNHTNENGEAYKNEIIVVRNVGEGNRLFAFNTYPRQSKNPTEIGDGWFRTYLYGSEWNGTTGMSGYADKLGNIKGHYDNSPDQVFNLYLFSNPNPYKAQIYYLGDQVTIASPATVPSGAASAKLMSAIVPEIEDNSGWVQDGAPVWSIVEQSSGAAMSIDAATGVLSTHGAAAGSYALVQVTYVLRDTASNAEHTVTTQAKAVIGETASYTHVIYENKSGMGTEVQYNVYKNANQTAGCTLPLDVYVVNNLTGASSKDGAVTVGGTAAWSVTNTTDATQTAMISADGKLDYSGITKNSILLVTVNGLTGAAREGAATAAKAGTFKVYVRVVSYTAEITHDNGTTGDFTAPFGATDIALGKVVRNADGNTAGAETFTLTETSAYQWEASHGAKITANANGTATLDVSGLEPGTVITVRVSGLEAKVGDAVTEVPHATVRVTVGDRPQNVTVENITVVIDYDRKVTIDLSGSFTVTNTELDTITLSDGAATDGFALAQIDGTWTVTFTPQGILREAKSCTYTVTAKDGSQAAGTITVQPASAVYYEDDNSAFTFTDGKHGKWATDKDGTTIDAQTSSLMSADIIGYDENYDVKTYAKYSAGSVHYVNVTEAVQDENLTPKNPAVEFDFAGTGFDVISVTSNNTGAFLIEVTNAAGESVFTKLLSTYRGYEYVPDGYVRTDYIPVIRCDENGTEDPDGQYSKTVTGTGENDFTVRLEPDGFYAKQADGTFAKSEAPGADGKWYVKREMTTQWRPVDDGENLDYYQIPVIRKLGLPYGVYHVKITAAYSRVFDVRQDGEYNFYFDAVRIYDPIEAEKGEYHYVSLRDAIIAAGTFGVTKYEDCGHKDGQGNSIAAWEVSLPAGYSDIATLNGRGLLTRTCSICGHPIDYAYFYVNATVAKTMLSTDAEPSSAALNYTISVESNAPEGAKEFVEGLQYELQNNIPPDVDPDWVAHWAAANEDVILCVDNTAYARGAGETYVTLDLMEGEIASGIRTETITVTGPRANLIQYAVHLEGHDGESGEFHEEDVILSRQVVPANQTSALLDPNKMFAYQYRMAETNLYHSLTEFIGWTEAPVSSRAFVSNAPQYYAVGEQYTPSGDITLYTLYHIQQKENTYVQTNTVPSSGKVILTRQAASINGDGAYITLTGSIKGDYCVNYVNKTYALPINNNMQSWKITQLTEGETTGIYLRTTSHGMYLRIDDAAGMELTNVPDDAILELVRDEENNCFYLYSRQTNKWLKWEQDGTAAVDSQDKATKFQLWREGDNHETESYATMLHEFADQSINQSNFDNESCWNYRITVCWCGQGDTYVKTSNAHNFNYEQFNDTHHVASCSVCGVANLEAHEFDATNTCTKCLYHKGGTSGDTVTITYVISDYDELLQMFPPETQQVAKGQEFNLAAGTELPDYVKKTFAPDGSFEFVHEYKFIGWSKTKVLKDNFVTEKPTDYLEGGATCIATEDMTLYALYSCEMVHNSYSPVKNLPTAVASVVLTAKSGNEEYAVSNIKMNLSYTDIQKDILEADGEKNWLILPPEFAKWTLENVNDSLVLKSADNKYLHINFSGLEVSEEQEGSAVLQSDGNGAFYLYNVQSGTWLALDKEKSGYKTVAEQANATPLKLYVYGEEKTETLYTTQAHELANVGMVSINNSPNCVEEGCEVTVCLRCGQIAAGYTMIPKTDHQMSYTSIDSEQHEGTCFSCGTKITEKHEFNENNSCVKCGYPSTTTNTTTSTSAMAAVTSETAAAGVAVYAEGDAETGDSGNTGGTDTGGTGNALNTIIGSGIIDGKGWLFDMEDFKKHGPKTEVYLAQNQAVVFYLENGMEGTDVQLGAKAVNGAAAGLTVITLTGGTGGAVKTIANRPLVSATEMYYEIGGDLVWSNGTSCVVIVMNTGEGVLALTNIRSTASLNVVMNRDATESGQAVLQRIAAGTMVYGPDDFITIVDSSKLPASPDPVKPDPAEPKPEPVKPDPVDPRPGEPSEPKPSDPKPETPSVTDFTDLDKDAWYYDGVRYAVEAGLMNGTGAKTFEPDGKLTRAMLVTILYRLAGAPEVKTTAKFTDVPADAWYAKAVAWAAGQKITNGTTATTFDPNGNVTREQLVTLLWRYAGEPKTEGKLDAFPDAAKVAPYAQTAFAWAVENGVIKGDLVGKIGYLAPQGEATRAQIAAIFMRSEKLLAND